MAQEARGEVLLRYDMRRQIFRHKASVYQYEDTCVAV